MEVEEVAKGGVDEHRGVRVEVKDRLDSSGEAEDGYDNDPGKL